MNLVFQIVGKSHLLTLRSEAISDHPFRVLSVVCKIFEKLVSNRLVDPIKKCRLLFYFQYGFRSSRSTTDLMLVVSDAIARAFDNSGAT